jgi:hypothetical protein
MEEKECCVAAHLGKVRITNDSITYMANLYKPYFPWEEKERPAHRYVRFVFFWANCVALSLVYPRRFLDWKMKMLLRYQETYSVTEETLLNALWHCPPQHPLTFVKNLAYVCDLKSEPLTTMTPPPCAIETIEEEPQLLRIENALIETFAHCRRASPPTIIIASLTSAERWSAKGKQLIVSANATENNRLKALVTRLLAFDFYLTNFNLNFDAASTLLFVHFRNETWWD